MQSIKPFLMADDFLEKETTLLSLLPLLTSLQSRLYDAKTQRGGFNNKE